jgi:hypothetical protein
MPKSSWRFVVLRLRISVSYGSIGLRKKFQDDGKVGFIRGNFLANCPLLIALRFILVGGKYLNEQVDVGLVRCYNNEMENREKPFRMTETYQLRK